MKNTKAFIAILLGLFLLVPISSLSVHFEETDSTMKNPSISAVPVITELGGGTDDYGGYKENYTDNFPWTYTEYWGLYWYVETPDTDIDDYWYNFTYGSLDEYNGTFTPIGPKGTYHNDINELVCGEEPNPNKLTDFGYLVEVIIEDSDNEKSEVFSMVFKYNNGTIEELPEELEFEATTEKSVINPNETIVVNFTISDPEGPRTYHVNYSCDYENFDSISNGDVTTTAAIFTPGALIYTWWNDRVTFNFTFNLTVWESSIMVDSKIDTTEVYVTSPPENGTCTILKHDGSGFDTWVYNISCSGWEDDLDGGGPFFYKCISKYELDNPDSYTVMHEGTNESDFQLFVTERYNGLCYIRIYDSHGAYTERYLGYLGRYDNPPHIPGFSTPITILSIIFVISILIGKLKKTPESN